MSPLIAAVNDFVTRRCIFDERKYTDISTSDIKRAMVADFGERYTDEDIRQMWICGVHETLYHALKKRGGRLYWISRKGDIGDMWSCVTFRIDDTSTAREIRNRKAKMIAMEARLKRVEDMLTELAVAGHLRPGACNRPIQFNPYPPLLQ